MFTLFLQDQLSSDNLGHIKKKTVGKSIWSKHCIKLWVKVFDHSYGYTTVILLVIVFTVFLINIKGLGWNMFNNNFINGLKSLLLSLPSTIIFYPGEKTWLMTHLKLVFYFLKYKIHFQLRKYVYQFFFWKWFFKNLL